MMTKMFIKFTLSLLHCFYLNLFNSIYYKVECEERVIISWTLAVHREREREIEYYAQFYTDEKEGYQ